MPVPSTRPSPELKLFLIRLLDAVDPEARLTMFEELPPRRGYVLKLERRGDAGKCLRLPGHMVDMAPRNRWAATMLERVLRTHVLGLRVRETVFESRLARFGLASPIAATTADPTSGA
jgi:hypothetical protein